MPARRPARPVALGKGGLVQGPPIGMGDSLIAGIVLAAGGILLTRNVKHFERVEGLRLSGRYPR